jgi:hypothetical protein
MSEWNCEEKNQEAYGTLGRGHTVVSPILVPNYLASGTGSIQDCPASPRSVSGLHHTETLFFQPSHDIPIASGSWVSINTKD